MIKSVLRLIAISFVLAVSFGCAHPISISPDLSQVKADANTKPITKNVGYYISDADRAKEFITPGGGGDKVSYKAYADLETALYKALGEVFSGVVKLSKAPTPDVMQREQLSYAVTPVIQTNSSSSSALTWPPTQFSVELTCSVVDATGKSLPDIKVTGTGKAEFDEFKRDFSLSAKRASSDAMDKLIKALNASAQFR